MSKLAIGAVLLAFNHAPAHHHQPHPRPGCRKLFTVAMTERAARAIYAGTRDVHMREYKLLGRMEMCQRNANAQSFTRHYNRRQRTLWRARREANLAPPLSSLARCIITAESQWDPYVVNSSGHMGYGQWDESTWLADGGGRYGHSPLDATPAQQERIIEEQVSMGHTSQWTDYDPC